MSTPNTTAETPGNERSGVAGSAAVVGSPSLAGSAAVVGRVGAGR